MYPVNEGAVEVLIKRAASYRQRACDERLRFADLAKELLSEMDRTIPAAKEFEAKAEEFEKAAQALMEARK